MITSFRTFVPFSIAYKIVLFLNSAVILFHLLVLCQLVPSNVVWAGRLNSRDEVIVFEIVSIVINLLLIFLAMAKYRSSRKGEKQMFTTVLLWLFAAIFVLNTLGNITASTTIEAYVATPLTFILAVCCARLAIQ